MKIHRFPQGSDEWWQTRLGIPTASRFDDLLTPKTLKPAAARDRYRAELVAEYLLGQPLDWGSSQWTERGTDMEDEARRWYEMHMEIDVERVGFITTDDGTAGGSPDGLVGTQGGLEIKCLGAGAHMQRVLYDVPEHIGQVQGGLWLTKRSWWDVLYYNPELPKRIIRVEPDPKWVAAFEPVLAEFSATLEADKITWGPQRVLRPWSPEMQAMMVDANR